MRQIKYIDRPDVLGSCVDCGATEVCAKCRSEIAALRHEYVQRELGNRILDGMYDLFQPERSKAKNWLGEDGDVFK